MPTEELIEARALFRCIEREERIAFCLGDLDFDDVCTTDVTSKQKVWIIDMLRAWGEKEGIGAEQGLRNWR